MELEYSQNDQESKARPGHEISDDYEREMSVINKVLAAAAKRKEEKQKSKGHQNAGPQVWLIFNQLISMTSNSWTFNIVSS